MLEVRALEGEQVCRCAVCGDEIKVAWFVDEDGLVTVVLAPAVDDRLRHRQWLDENRPPERLGNS